MGKSLPTKEEIRKQLEEYFKDIPNFAEHYKNGDVSMWTFRAGGNTIRTGDGGAILMMDAMKDEFKKRFGKLE